MLKFLDDFWEQRKLGKICNTYSGGTPSVTDSSYYNGNIPFIRSAEINSETTELFLTKSGLKNSSAKLVEKGSILYAMYGATSGEVGISKINGAINQAILAIHPHENYNSYFIMQWLRLNKEQIISTYLQGGQGNLSGSIIKSLKIEFPNSNEQQIIGDFFNLLDKNIDLHQRKLDRLKNLKKAILQLMFPEKNHSAPKLRFNNFSEVWEQRKLSEEAVITMGQSPNGKNYTDNPNDYILIQGNADMKNGKVAPRVWTTQVTKTADPKDIILSVRAPVGDVGKTDFHAVLGRGVAGIKGNEFLYQALVWMKMFGYWTKVSTGSTFESINSTDLKNAIISCPGNNEQRRIGKFLNHLDKAVELHQRKLDSLERLKASYLQLLFPQ
ncbi:MAG: restriction endonuclease subunit S [Senegalia sp. (in: firmicutes)]